MAHFALKTRKMEGSINFTPLLGAGSDEPLSYLLEIDGFNILLDCGWSYAFNTSDLEPLLSIVNKIDAVLLSHSDIYHIGALPYLQKHGLNCPVYATLAVWYLGQLIMKDAYHSCASKFKFEPFSLSDMDAVFQSMKKMKHGQVVELSGKGAGISLAPKLAGHSVGGAFWRISKGSENILYAVDFNHSRRGHLEGSSLNKERAPTLLIGDCLNALSTTDAIKKTARDAQFIDLLVHTLRTQANVLLPIDLVDRSLELLLLLHQKESRRVLDHSHLIFLSASASAMIDHLKTLTEFCVEEASEREDFFAFPHLHICSSIEEMLALPAKLQLPPRPFVVLACDDALSSTSLALQLLQHPYWSNHNVHASSNSSEKNLVLFTQRALLPGSIAYQLQQQLFSRHQQQQQQHELMLLQGSASHPIRVVCESKYNVPLTGEELAQFYEQKRLREQQEGGMDDDQAEDEDDPDNFEFELSSSAMSATSSSAFGATPRSHLSTPSSSSSASLASFPSSSSASSPSSSSSPSSLSYSSFTERVIAPLPNRFGTSAAFPMFPSLELDPHIDEFGVAIKPNEYRVVDESPFGDAFSPSNMGNNSGTHGIGIKKSLDGDASNQSDQDLPVAVHTRQLELELKCSLAFVDYEGRTDGRWMKNCYKLLAPRAMILIHGNEENKQHMKEYCEKNISNCRNVFVPSKGQFLHLVADLSVFSIKIKDSMDQMLKFKELLDDYEVAWFDGQIRMESGHPTLVPAKIHPQPPITTLSSLTEQPESIDELIELIAREEQGIDGMSAIQKSASSEDAMDADAEAATAASTASTSSSSHTSPVKPSSAAPQAPSQSATIALNAKFGPPAGWHRAAAWLLGGGSDSLDLGGGLGGHPPLFLGDLQLHDVKRALNQEAIQADFVSGGLVCAGGSAFIRKVSSTHISITGTLCEDYYRIRELLYAQFVKV